VNRGPGSGRFLPALPVASAIAIVPAMGPGHVVGELVEPRLTYEDYCALPEDGQRYQIIEGDLDVTPAPSASHQRVSRNLVIVLGEHVRRHRLGAVFDAPFDVLLAQDTVVQPDLLFVARERLSSVTERGLEGPPDLIIEILSPATRRLDRTRKMRVYARFGVRECWLVDPEAQSFEVFRLAGAAYVLAQASCGRETVSSELFPGLTLALEELFAPD
jgi:Uma2 family endonuclease